MMAASEIREWLDTLPADAMVGINDDGMALELYGHPEVYIECGMFPEDTDD